MPKGTRPTQNIVRKAVFDMIGGDLEGIEFLELFAGSGAMGLEALSRNAQKATFIEKDPKFAEVIRENLRLLNVDNRASIDPAWEILNIDAFVAIKTFARQKRTFDVVFIDPPYSRGLGKKILKTLNAYDILHPNSLLIFEHKKAEILPSQEGRFFLCRQKKYGIKCLSLYQLTNPSSSES